MRVRIAAESLRALRRYKGRTALIVLATFVGVTVVTFVLSVGDAVEDRASTTIRQLFGGSSILVMAGGTQLLGGPRPDAARLTIDDIAAVATAVGGLETWDPQQALPSASVKAGSRVTVARILGQSERSPRVWNRPAIRGTFFDAAAVRASERVAVVGESVARALFDDTDPVGRDLLVESVPFRIVGVLQRFGTDLHGMDRDNEIVVPITTLMRRVLNVDTIIAARLNVEEGASPERVATGVRRVLRERHALAEGQRDDFTLMTPEAVQQMSGMVRRAVSTYVPLAGLVLLGLSMAGTALLMLVSVTGRASEIGVRRAVGATPGDVALQFVLETTLTSTVAGVLGAALGTIGAQALARFLHYDLAIAGRAVLAGVVLSIVTGLLAGVLPARRAAKLEPAAILR
jgi:putative ABC transport system permease protein